MADRFLIAPFRSGLVKDLEPFLTPDDAFEELNNAYVFRGKVKKRFGSAYIGSSVLSKATAQLNSRLRIALTGGAAVGITDASGDANGTLPGAIFKVGQAFSIGTEIFTVSVLGTPADMLTTGAATTFTLNTTSGAYIFAGAAALTQIYFYPSEPVMGFAMFEGGPINNHPAFAYDTQFIYKFSGTAWGRVGTALPVLYTGTNTDYFWTTNWNGITDSQTAMFSTNFNTTTPDNMYYSLDGTTWVAFKPKFKLGTGTTATKYLVATAKIILPFKNRLILLNTYEGDDTPTNAAYTNRCRYSWNGSPIDAAGYSWLEPDEANYGGAGYMDAPTEEAIVSAEFIRDRLIVYFERSTWELAYTGSEILPFVWQKLNTELGSEATFSSVPFDTHVLNIGTTGIHACSGMTVERIDQNIPDEVSKALNTETAIIRIHGIRDYDAELVYWTIPQPLAADTNSYTDKVLVYNYKNRTWALNDDSITVWGYFEQTVADTWEGDYETWEADTSTWDAGVKLAQHRQVIAGNQQGYTFVIDKIANTNASVLQVTNVAANVLTVLNHNLKTNDFIELSNMNGLTDVANGIYKIYNTTESTVTLDPVMVSYTGTYLGGGTAAKVSKVSIKSKEWNPYLAKGAGVCLDKISFCVAKTASGEFTVNYNSSSSNRNLAEDGALSGSNLGTYILETSPYELFPIEDTQDRLWHSIYFQAYGSGIQIHIEFTDEQMTDSSVVGSEFEIQGMILQTRSASNLELG